MVRPKDAPPEPDEVPKKDEGQSQTDAAADGATASAEQTPPPQKPPPPKQAKAKGYAHLFKFVFVGDSGVGKSSLLRRYTRGEFSPSRDYTIGVDFEIKTTSLSNGDEVKLQLWDTAGQERFRSITTSYYRGSHGVFIVYNVNDKDSFDNVSRWLQEATRYCNDDAVIVIAGNMTDRRTLTSEFFGKDLVKELDVVKNSEPPVLAVYECSSKSGEGVEQIFQETVEELVTRIVDARNPLRKGKTLISGKNVRLGMNSEMNKKKGCC